MTLRLDHVAGPASGPEVLVATMHGKEAVLGPRLAALGYRVLLPVGYDTDVLGTFTGDVPRPGTAFDAALEKARRACRAAGVPRAVSSEGTYRPCQRLFPGARNAELLAFVDVEAGVEIVEHATDLPTRFANGRVRPDPDAPEVRELLARIGWPEIRAMAIPDDRGNSRPAFKGIGTRAELAEALAACAAASDDGLAHLETDLRAHMNHTRMASIAIVADRLAAALAGRTGGARDARRTAA